MFAKRELFEGILLAAGSGQRFGLNIPKQFTEIKPDYTVIEKSFEAISPFCCKIILMLPQNYQVPSVLLDRLQAKAQEQNCQLIMEKGGFTRQQSVYKAFQVIETEYLFIHDGARPLIHANDLQNLLENVIKFKAAILAVPISDTMKQTKERFIQQTLPRENLWAAQTPQAFDRLIFERALSIAKKNNFSGTDDASLVEHSGFPVKIVESHHLNFKITYQKELKLLKQILAASNF